MADWFRDPTFAGACQLERQRKHLITCANLCRFRLPVLVAGGAERCGRGLRNFDRCSVCRLAKKRGDDVVF